MFDWLAVSGRIAADEMRRTFNCGVGMVVVVDQRDVETTLNSLAECGETAWRLGTVGTGSSGVRYD